MFSIQMCPKRSQMFKYAAGVECYVGKMDLSFDKIWSFSLAFFLSYDCVIGQVHICAFFCTAVHWMHCISHFVFLFTQLCNAQCAFHWSIRSWILCVRKVTMKSYQLLSHFPNRRTCLCCCRCCFWCGCGCRCGCHCRCCCCRCFWRVWENRQWEISFYHILPTVALKLRPQITDNCDPRRKHNRMVCSICLTTQWNNSTCCFDQNWI